METKTATVKERPILMNGEMVRAVLDGRKTQTRRIMKTPPDSFEDAASIVSACPYGEVGDRLWVRENFSVVPYPGVIDMPRLRIGPHGRGITWQADWQGNPSGFKWKPSIHMPRWASRITLEITGIRVERLNAISEEDAIAEGCIKLPATGRATITDARIGKVWKSARHWYRELWESINGNDTWSLNPWVWAIEFKPSIHR